MICETVPAADPPFGQSTQEHCSVESGTDENIFTNTDTNQIGNSEGFAQSVYSEEIKEDAPENEDKHNAITEGMENMITDSVGKESTTDEGVIEKDKTNAAFENVLTQSTAAKAEATEAYKKSDLETARLKYMTALELLQVSW